MTILKERVKRVNSPYEMDYVDDWEKNLKICLGRAWRKTKEKRKYARHQNVIETKEHRARTLFKKHFCYALFCKMSFYI